MKTQLRQAITEADIAQLREAHAILTRLMTGLHPASAPHAPLYAAIATLKACAVDWSGRSDIWSTANTQIGRYASPNEPRP